MARQAKPKSEVEIVRRELNKNKGQWKRLARLAAEQKDGLTHRWISAFACGEIRDPGFSRLKKLGAYLGFRIKIEQGPHFNRFDPRS